MVFFSSAWWPENLWRQTGLQPIFNSPLLWHLTFKISWVFALPVTPSSAVAAFLLWINLYSPGPPKSSCVRLSLHSSSSHLFLIIFWFQAAPDPISFTRFFSLSLVWPLRSAGGSRKEREWTEWRSNGKREEIETKDAFKANYVLSPHPCGIYRCFGIKLSGGV